MKFSKPKVSRVYVEARDPDSKARVFLTIYDCTVQQVKDRLKGVEDKPRKREAPSAVPA